ncbi:MAG TPA: hypothetical protein PLE74_07155 [Candidatus Cloacimonadota bacterium]|nr:hypothetical protein [Candidatus Cloacimonadota bacterium]
MSLLRARINLAFEELIEKQDGITFQRLSYQALRTRWPSLVTANEKSDLGEDARTISCEDSDGIRRSLICSLRITFTKLQKDIARIKSENTDVDELIIATLKILTRKTQKRWENELLTGYGLRLIIIDRSEFIAVLEKPESQWLCQQYLNIQTGYIYQYQLAKQQEEKNDYVEAIINAKEAEKGAISNSDWELLCKIQLLLAVIYLYSEGLEKNYPMLADNALATARNFNLISLLPECLIRSANSHIKDNPKKSRLLLAEVEKLISTNPQLSKWFYLNLAELEFREKMYEKAEEALNVLKSITPNISQTDNQNYYHLMSRIEMQKGNLNSAMEYLNKALKSAKKAKRAYSIGWIIREKAYCLDKQGNYYKAAQETENAMHVFEKANIRVDFLDTALMACHLFRECNYIEHALDLVNLVISKSNIDEFKDLFVEALQIRTDLLIASNKVNEAFESNTYFRNTIKHIPDALIIADLQDGNIAMKKGYFKSAEEFFSKSHQRTQQTEVKKEITALIKLRWSEAKFWQAKYKDAISLAGEVIDYRGQIPKRMIDKAEKIIQRSKERASITSIFNDILNHPKPLKWAGTDKSTTIQEAHQEIIRPLLEWKDTWPEASTEIYDFWGKGNLARYILNHRGFDTAFHVTVEATSVNQARQWVRVLCPYVDVLTILWKGPMIDNGFVFVPVNWENSNPGGWGYMIAAGDQIKPHKRSKGKWSPAMGMATLLPKDAIDFLFIEARNFFETGRLFLFPATNLGCIDKGHGPIEKMFNDIVNASSFLTSEGNNLSSINFGNLPLPFFPEIPLSELSQMVNGEAENLLETRLCLRDWSRFLKDREMFETQSMKIEIHERLESSLNKIRNKFNILTKKLEWAKQEGEISSYTFDSSNLEVKPMNPAACQLVDLHNEIRSTPWYSFFRLSSQGNRWDLLSGNEEKKSDEANFESKKIFHWLVPPESGWIIPTAKKRI